ncbi:MAG: hypothetical protein NTZ25_04990 [Candidatus Peregrinibacteria bacterium]|nr:hypothetical protein [Candidatus Peregrinibacteria bacterium]
MVKKLLAKLALAIMIGVMTTPIVFAGPAGSIEDLGAALDDIKDKPCIEEVIPNATDPSKPTPGPDDGYVISIIEEPLNVDADETNPDYKIRRCFRNTFQYRKNEKVADKVVNGKVTTKDSWVPKTSAMLAKTCSNNAQELMKTNKDNVDLKVSYTCKEVQAILTKGGTSAIYGYINMIYRWGASLVGIIAVTIIIISGIQISASGGDSEAVNSAKKRILQSVVGIIVLFLSSLILYTVNPTFFTNG